MIDRLKNVESNLKIKYKSGILSIISTLKQRISIVAFALLIYTYHQNTRGLQTKTHSLFISACVCAYDVIAVTESWLNQSINSSELSLPSYNICIVVIGVLN